MKVCILAAGYGTRLYPIIKDQPKALLEVNDKSLVNHILDKLKDLPGLNEVIIVTNDKFHKVFQQWADGQEEYAFSISIVNDGTKTPEDRLGSIGDIEFVLKQGFNKEDLLVVGGDNLFSYNVDDFVRFAQEKDGSVTIGLFDIHDLQEAKKFGVVAVDETKKITSFEEKPESPRSTLIGMCFYYLPKKTLGCVGQYLGESKKSDKAGDYIKWLTYNGEVYGFTFTGKWYDIGSVESYEEAQKEFIS